MALRLFRISNPIRAFCQVRMMSGTDSQQPGWGSGAGKGGGSGGTVREAGGSFGKMEAAHEEQYFRKLQAEQLEKLKAHHEEEIARHKKKIADLRKMQEDTHK